MHRRWASTAPSRAPRGSRPPRSWGGCSCAPPVPLITTPLLAARPFGCAPIARHGCTLHAHRCSTSHHKGEAEAQTSPLLRPFSRSASGLKLAELPQLSLSGGGGGGGDAASASASTAGAAAAAPRPPPSAVTARRMPFVRDSQFMTTTQAGCNLPSSRPELASTSRLSRLDLASISTRSRFELPVISSDLGRCSTSSRGGGSLPPARVSCTSTAGGTCSTRRT